MSFRVSDANTAEFPCDRMGQRFDLLSIQKFLQKSTGSAGLLMLHEKPIVIFKNVALNFPPLEQGPAGD